VSDDVVVIDGWCMFQSFVTDSRWFKSTLRRLCCSQVQQKKLLIERVMSDVSWPPVGESTTVTEEQNIDQTHTQTHTRTTLDGAADE